jgi:ArsR family transcriptional regulator
VERHPEGAWVFYRLSDNGPAGTLIHDLCRLLDAGDPVLGRDRERLGQVKRNQADEAKRYFSTNASEWDTIRALHVAEDQVEDAMLRAIGQKPFDALLDLGTGTGRLLELFSPFYQRAIGVDSSTAMLAVARANLDRAGLGQAQVRLGDIYNLPLPRDAFDVVTIHQVLHYLDEPESAVVEAARMLAPGGRLLIVDFAPHELEFLRERHAHRRLGFGHGPMEQWVGAAALDLEAVVDLRGDESATGKLTVTLWLARDRRVVVAGDAAEREIA